MARKRKPKKPDKPPVRKSRLDDPKVQEQYLKALAKGTHASAAATVGFTPNGAARYRRDHPEFQERCRVAEAKCKGAAESIVFKKAIEGEEEWALKLLLYCKFRWAHFKPDTYTVKDVILLCSAIGAKMAAAMPIESQVAARRIVDEELMRLLQGGGNGK